MNAVLSWMGSGGSVIFSSRSAVATNSVLIFVAFAMDFRLRGAIAPALATGVVLVVGVVAKFPVTELLRYNADDITWPNGCTIVIERGRKKKNDSEILHETIFAIFNGYLSDIARYQMNE